MKSSSSLWVGLGIQSKKIFKFILLWLVRSYQVAISPILGGACRFEPSCSRYAVEALQAHAPHQAVWLIVKRLSKCRPGGPSGYDPVPGECHHCGGTLGA